MAAGRLPLRILARHRWVVFVVPLLVYMLLGQWEPRPDAIKRQDEQSVAQSDDEKKDANSNDTPESNWFGESWFGLNVSQAYPLYYAFRLLATVAVMALLTPGYRLFPCRFTWLGLLVGLLGGLLWIGVCQLQVEGAIAQKLGWPGYSDASSRAGYNPFLLLAASPAALAGFLAVRFLGLALIVPIIEEFFLRGFVMRFVVDPDRWWKVPVGTVTTAAIVAGTVYGMLTHPAELLAAGLWFSLITWLMVKTRSLWDCVAAHGVTNFMLGVWVLTTGNWHLW